MKTFYIAVFCAALGLNSAACTSSTESTGKAEKKTAINAQTTSAPTAQQANAANSDTAAVTENVNAVLNPMDQAKQKRRTPCVVKARTNRWKRLIWRSCYNVPRGLRRRIRYFRPC